MTKALRTPMMALTASLALASGAMTARQPAADEPPPTVRASAVLSATQLNASASVAGTLVYASAPGPVLPAGAQVLSVTFTPEDAANFTTASLTNPVQVLPATPIITWATPTPITYGTPLSATQLNATASTAGTFTYTPAAGAVLNAGEQVLTVVFTPLASANYTSATATGSISPERFSDACLAQIERGSPARTSSSRRYAAAWAPRSSFTTGLRLSLVRPIDHRLTGQACPSSVRTRVVPAPAPTGAGP